ncbi:single-stranded DNA-binding protein [Curtobacterium flaccumfaciens pv. flaccumfaciens]|uniref:single-stranded DNA-binding protein n=1 Tax=Curtobacterium flaccumfaciens TaxID=2035 RepID=UPI00217E994C|nr:single-stranded DNA-binding protein [Curtobacterium flaccumfaciens]MCS6570304.1 single-stranded DNA-binding protein [Curtobacterium flaccumfaciens pv. flaccumfaciens]MCS6585160.1 single-stranded DNA-binding protein [Curtobacterium flaccumfaciens pv. flaccumfaciens]
MSRATITVEGFVSKDPELRTVNGKPVIAVDIPHTPRKKDANDQWVDAGDTIWFQAGFWERDAQAIADTVRKGTLVTVTGFPELNVYQRQDGTPGVSVRIKGGTLGIIPRQPQQGQGAPNTPPASARPTEPWNTPQAGAQDAWSTASIPDDETPF